MLTKNDIAQEIEEMTGVKPNLVKNVMDAMAEIAADEVANGEDFAIPGIERIVWRYRKPQAKGARWKKGEEVQGFGGIVQTKDSDSPPVKAQARLVAVPTGDVNRAKPKRDPVSQAAFLKTRAGKAIAARRG